MNLYDRIINYLKSRGLVLVEEYIPYYLCSIGCHIANLLNHRCHKGCDHEGCRWHRLRLNGPDSKGDFYHRFGNLVNTRLHILLVAPPGFSKSFFTLQFLRQGMGLVAGAIRSNLRTM